MFTKEQLNWIISERPTNQYPRGEDFHALAQQLLDAMHDLSLYEERLREALVELRCPDCGCSDQEDAESSECGCDGPVCMRSSEFTLAEWYKRLRANCDRLQERAEALEGALRRTKAEIRGVLGLAENELRQAAGNTNVNALKYARDKTSEALAAGVQSCHAEQDGDCEWAGCPQLRGGEPSKSGRHCPPDTAGQEKCD